MLEQQNSPEQLDRLAAQRRLYSDAKCVEGLRVLLAGPVAVLLSLVALKWPSARPFVALYAIAAVTADNLWLIPWTKALRKTAAKIQEMFDCDVLSLSWNELRVGQRPDPEMIAASAARYKRKRPGYPELNSWYPDKLSVLPESHRRIICQRASCWWDAALRQRFKRVIVALAVSVTILLVLIGLVGGMKMDKFLLVVVAPAVPAWNFAIRKLREDSEAATTVARLKEYADKLWSESRLVCLPDEDILFRCRQLQDEIYDHRCRAPLIPDSFYFFLRGDQQSGMDDAADAFIREFIEAKNSTQPGTSMRGVGI